MPSRNVADARDLDLARRFADGLYRQFGSRISEIRLYGSRARGDASEESDLDLFVALSTDDPRREVKAAAAKLASDLTLEHGVVLSVIVADRAFLEAHRGYSFLETIAEEGVPL